MLCILSSVKALLVVLEYLIKLQKIVQKMKIIAKCLNTK